MPLVALAQLQADTAACVCWASRSPECAPRRLCHAAQRPALEAPNIVAEAQGMTLQRVNGAAKKARGVEERRESRLREASGTEWSMC